MLQTATVVFIFHATRENLRPVIFGGTRLLIGVVLQSDIRRMPSKVQVLKNSFEI